MANAFLTPDKIISEGLMHLENNLIMGNMIRKDYSSEYTTVGDTISIRAPAQYSSQADNLDITSYREDIQQRTVPIQMNRTETVAVEIGAKERTFDFNRLSEDVIKPAMIRLADRVETEIASQYYKYYHFDGTPGTIPSTFKSLAGPGARLTDGAVPTTGRVAFHSPDASVELADGLKGVYVQSKAKTAFEEAEIGRYGGFTNYETVYAPTHTVGVATGTPLVNGGSQNVTYAASKATFSQTLVTDGWTNSTTGIVKKGDVITIAGVYAVNPVSKVSTGRLQTFTVLADADSGASTGPASLTISPPIITSGAYQTVTAAPADNAAITVKTGTGGTAYRQSMLIHPDSMALVTRKLDIPSGQGLKTTTKSGNAVTVSCTEFVDGNTLAQTFRFDILFKAEVIDPRLGGRLTN